MDLTNIINYYVLWFLIGSVLFSLIVNFIEGTLIYQFKKSKEGFLLIKYLSNEENMNKFKNWMKDKNNVVRDIILDKLLSTEVE